MQKQTNQINFESHLSGPSTFTLVMYEGDKAREYDPNMANLTGGI